MAKTPDNRSAGLTTRGRRSHTRFERLVSPLGQDGAENNDYSPASTVEGARQYGGRGGVSQSESARAQRRGEQ
jgi:hypothetical protein